MKPTLAILLLISTLLTLSACAGVGEDLPDLVRITAAPTPTATPEPTPTPVPTPSPTPIPTPTATPVPTPTPDDGTRPNVVGLYLPGSGERVRQDEFTGPWVKGQDIDCFEVLASDADKVSGRKFSTMFKELWEAFPKASEVKIGYTLSYKVEEGKEIVVTIQSPEDVAHTEYLECWLYDDIHQTPGVRYSHLTEKEMKEETLITSIKLTCGKKIAAVSDLRLAAFLYRSDADFDAEGRYIGPHVHEIAIHKK